MSVLASLITALQRAKGDRIVLCSGETPHVVADGTRHDLGTTKASVKAVEALIEQILTPEARQQFATTNAALEPLSDAISPIPLVVGTHRSGDTVRIELRRLRPAASVPAAPAVVTSDREIAEPAIVPSQILVRPDKPAVESSAVEPPPVIQHPESVHSSEWQPVAVPPPQAATSESDPVTVARLEELTAAATQHVAERERLEQRIAELEGVASDQAAERAQLEARIAELAHTADEHAIERTQLQARISELEVAATASAVERERLEQRIANLESAATDQAERIPLQTRIDELARAAEEHAVERNQLQTRIAELQAAADTHVSERERAEARVAELEVSATASASERERLEQRIAELEAAASSHASERERLEARSAELEAAASSHASQRERLEARSAELEAAASASAIERGRLEARIAELEALTIDANSITSESAARAALAVDTEPGPEDASFGAHQLKIVPIAAAMRAGAATIASDSTGGSDAERLEYWIGQAAQREATALYLRAGQAPVLRVRQRLQPLDDQQLDGAVVDRVTTALAAGENDWLPVSETAWTRELDGIGRVTCQTFVDDCGAGLVVHLSRGAASVLCKDIPRQVRRACEEDHGLVIVSAPALPEVMQMVAALGEWTAQRRAGYLVSIEPPNGLGHDISGTLVSTRRIAGTERDVAGAIRRAMHEGPDILVIALASGLIAEEAIRAAQSGCLVIVGAIAPTAPRAIESLLSSINADHGQTLRQSLAASFRCGFSYRALPGRDGSRAVVQDLLIGTSDVRGHLERGDLSGVESLQRSGVGGMRSLDAALAGAVHRRQTSLRRAAGMASDRRELVRLVRRSAHERNRAARGRSGNPSSDSAHAVAGVGA